MNADCRIGVSLPSVFLLLGLFGSQNAFAAVNANVHASRVSGVAPLAVFFDATSTTSTATNRPFHEVHYEWDFGDPAAGSWQYGNQNNTDKNKARGPVAAHVFETPGTHTITLTTTDTTGATDSDAVTITVQDPDVVFSGTNTVCFSTSSNFSGCPSGAHRVVTSDIALIESNIGPGRRLLLRRGETWSNGSLDIHSDGPGTIGAFGTGNKPVLDNIGIDVAPGISPILGEPGTRDWRVMDLEFIYTQARAVASEGEFENLLLLRLEVHQTAAQSVFFPGSTLEYYNTERGQQHEPHDGVFVVESSMVDAASYAVGRRYAVLGCFWNGGGTTHTNRYPYIGKGVISHNYYERPGNNSIHLIKLHAPNWDGNGGSGALYSPGTETREVVLSDNHFHGTIENWSVSIGPQSPRSYANEHVVDVIIERNLFTAENGSPRTQLHTAGYNISVRNNIFDLTSGGSGAHAASASTRNAGQPPVYGFWFHNNSICRSDAGAVGVSSSATDTEIHNNIVHSSAGSSTLGCSNGTSGCLNNLVNADPLWSNPDSGDFTLQYSSPAIDSGVVIPVFDDYSSNRRPLGGNFDIGAYESNGGTVSVPVPKPTLAPTATITANPTSLTAGYSTTLTWTSSDADSCTASGDWNGNKGTDGTETVYPTSDATYIITCTGIGGSGSASASVSVTQSAQAPARTQNPTPAPSTNDFEVGIGVVLITPANLRDANLRGTGARQDSGATGVIVGGPQNGGGTQFWDIDFDSGADGWVRDTQLSLISATLSPTPTPTQTLAATATITANPTSLLVGDSATLTWASSNADSCVASGGWSGIKGTDGTESVSPPNDAIYTITCTGTGGSASDSVTVNVTQPTATSTPGGFGVGTRVVLTSPANLRDANLRGIGAVQDAGTTGVIVGGPQSGGGGTEFWDIDFDSGGGGWVRDTQIDLFGIN